MSITLWPEQLIYRQEIQDMIFQQNTGHFPSVNIIYVRSFPKPFGRYFSSVFYVVVKYACFSFVGLQLALYLSMMDRLSNLKPPFKPEGMMIHIRHFHKEQGLCAQNTDVDIFSFVRNTCELKLVRCITHLSLMCVPPESSRCPPGEYQVFLQCLSQVKYCKIEVVWSPHYQNIVWHLSTDFADVK